VPLTLTQHEKSLQDPAICELLPVRDYLDDVMVRIDGSLVAGYQLNGLTTYFASDEGRDRGKLMLEALLRSLPDEAPWRRLRLPWKFGFKAQEKAGQSSKPRE
jgi:hypothetical protein